MSDEKGSGMFIKLPIGEYQRIIREKDENIIALRSRVEELERENNRLASKAHDLLSQLEIATDLGQKRWVALNEIVEHAGMKSSDWCRRIAKEGLGLK